MHVCFPLHMMTTPVSGEGGGWEGVHLHEKKATKSFSAFAYCEE